MARPDARDNIARYNEAKAARSPFEPDMKIAAANVYPQQYHMWQQDGPPMLTAPSAVIRRSVYDSTGARSLPKYMAILERLMTPQGQRWHTLRPTDTSLRKSYRVRDYFDQLTDKLFTMRYNPRSQFIRASNEIYAGLGTYGHGPFFLGMRKPNALYRGRAFIYRPYFQRDIFMLANANGEIDTVIRRFWYNVRQFRQEWPNDTMPKQMAAEATKPTPDENRYWEFIHIVQPRTDFDPQMLDARRHPFVSSYIEVVGAEYVGKEEGFRSLPYLVPRVGTSSGTVYGMSPAMRVIPAMGGANQMKKTNLEQGNLAVKPTLLAHDDGVLNGEVGIKPGYINYGGVNRDGRPLIHALDMKSNFRVGEVLLQDEQKDIEDAFFVSVFQVLQENPNMTATQVIELVADRATLLSPTMGSLQSEFGGPMIEREIDLLDEMNMLPEMPPELIEAGGDYEVNYTSPMARGMYMEEVSGFARSLELATNIVNATQDQSAFDHYDFDTAIPEITDIMGAPTRWTSTPEAIEQKRGARQQQTQESELLKNAAPLAGALKTAATMQEGTPA